MSSNQVHVRGFFDGPCRLPDPVPIPVPRRTPGAVAGALAMLLGLALMSGQASAQAYQDNMHQSWRNAGCVGTPDSVVLP